LKTDVAALSVTVPVQNPSVIFGVRELEDVHRNALRGLSPPPKLRASEWIEREVRLVLSELRL